MKSLRIEICQSWKPNLWNIRIGDIKGCVESSNIEKEDVIDEIKDRMGELEEEDEC